VFRDLRPYSASGGPANVSGVARPTLITLTRDECLSLLATATVGRVGISVDSLPVVLPVNFALIDADVVFRTVEGTKFHAATAKAVVAFEADSYEPSGESGWSVVVQGMGEVVSSASEQARLAALTINPWAVDGADDRFVRVRADRITGRRFAR